MPAMKTWVAAILYSAVTSVSLAAGGGDCPVTPTPVSVDQAVAQIPAAEDNNGLRPHPTAPLKFWDEIPLSPSTRIPAVIKDEYWNGEFQRVNREVARADKTGIIFFGDSITWNWSLGKATGRDVWNENYSRYNPINMGNSGDITPVMLYRATHGNLDFPKGRQPKVAVLLCGINNFGVTQSAGGAVKWDLGINCPPADVANGQRAIAQEFRRRLPETRLIMMAILPVANKVKWAKCQQVNAINAAMERDENEVAFVNLQDKFLLPDGSINKQLYTDGTHLTAKGYQVWAKGIEPLVLKFMNAPPLHPVKNRVGSGH